MSQAEVDSLKAELKEKVKQYESKLATLTVINGALKKEVEELQEQLEEDRPDAEEELEELKEEFAQRLTVADKQVASLKDELQRLRGKLSQASQGGTVNEALLLEKDEAVEEYKREGEALMKRMNELEGVLKRVRAGAKDAEAERDRLAARLAGAQAEAEVSAAGAEEELKEEQERADQLRAQLAEMQRECEEKISGWKRESEVTEKLEQADKAQSVALEGAHQREQAMAASIHNLQESLSEAEATHSARVEVLSEEVRRLEQRCRDAEARREDLATRSVEASVPLLRQVEATLQDSVKQRAAAAQVEAALSSRLQAALAELAQARESERVWKAKYEASTTAAAVLRDTAAFATVQLEEAHSREEEERRRSARLKEDVRRAQQSEAAAVSRQAETAREVKEAEGQVQRLQAQLSLVHLHQEELQAQWDRARAEKDQSPRPTLSPRDSAPSQSEEKSEPLDFPVLKAQDPTVIGSLTSLENEDDIMRALLEDKWGVSEVPNGQTPGGRLAGGASESKRSRQMQGEILELRRQLAYEKKARSHDSHALVSAMEESHRNMELAKENPRLHERAEQMENKLATCLEILGERNERVEQLEMDNGEMRAVYKEQIDILATQVALLSSNLERRPSPEQT